MRLNFPFPNFVRRGKVACSGARDINWIMENPIHIAGVGAEL